MILRPVIDHPYDRFNELEIQGKSNLVTELMLMADHLVAEDKSINISVEDLMELDVPDFKLRLLWELSNRRHRAALKKLGGDEHLGYPAHYQFSFGKKEIKDFDKLEKDLFLDLYPRMAAKSIGDWLTTFDVDQLKEWNKLFKEKQILTAISPHHLNATHNKFLSERVDYILNNFALRHYENRYGSSIFDPVFLDTQKKIRAYIFEDGPAVDLVNIRQRVAKQNQLVSIIEWETATEEQVNKGIELAERLVVDTEVSGRDVIYLMGMQPMIAKSKEQYDKLVELRKRLNGTGATPVGQKEPEFVLQRDIGTKELLKAFRGISKDRVCAEAYVLAEYFDDLKIDKVEVYPYQTDEELKKLFADFNKKYGGVIIHPVNMPYDKKSRDRIDNLLKEYDVVVMTGMGDDTTHYCNGQMTFDGLGIRVHTIAKPSGDTF